MTHPLDPSLRRRLAEDLGCDMDSDVTAVLARHGFGPPGLDERTAALLGDPDFQRMVDEAHRRMLVRRARTAATRAVLDTVPEVVEIVRDRGQPARARVSGVDTLARVAGLTDQDQGQQTPPFTISINIPGGGLSWMVPSGPSTPSLPGTAEDVG